MNPFDNGHGDCLSPTRGFKATSLWNELVYAFCYGVPVRKHRKHLKYYDDCFLAKDSVDWIHHYLMASPYFENQEIERQQAVQLLRKFLRFDIILRVGAKEGKIYNFEDNKDLYCFSQVVKEKLPMQAMPRAIGGVITASFWRWHEIVYAFWLGMPVGRHVKGLKIHNECFVAKYAVNWIHHYLIMSPYFKKRQLSRFQAVQLLRKFVKFDVIKKIDSNGEIYDFRDNRDLYCFTHMY
ncbi:DEP domain-containing protein 1A [Halotydeus destructor]|nr:DEP domain-containing protein 1A [Halotydeus destructor]